MNNFFTASNTRIFNIGIGIIVVLMVVARLPSLHVPYFWDELGVYAPGALHMKDAGTIGIMPADLEPLYSRGHPLLFYFFAASFFKIFGDSIAVGHIFAILSASITLLVFYFFTKKILNAKCAFWASLLLAVQPIFFTMAGVLFPEMLLTLFVILSIWGIIENKWWLYVVGGSLAILVKEPAIVLPAAALCILFIESLKQKDFFTTKRWKLFILAIIPYMVFGVFLIIQKKQNGWYFFPYHIDLISLHWDSLYYGFKRMLGEIFIEQGRWLLTIPFVVSVIRFKQFYGADKKMKRVLMVFAVFIFLAFVFSSFNFYLSRYLLFVYPLMMVIFSDAVLRVFNSLKNSKLGVLGIPVFAVCAILLSISQMDTGKFKDTYDMSYIHTVACVQDCISWVEKQPWKETGFRAAFPVFQGLNDKRNGYLSGNPLPNTDNMEKHTQYIVYFNLTGDDTPETIKRNQVIKRFDNAHSHIVVYKSVE